MDRMQIRVGERVDDEFDVFMKAMLWLHLERHGPLQMTAQEIAENSVPEAAFDITMNNGDITITPTMLANDVMASMGKVH